MLEADYSVVVSTVAIDVRDRDKDAEPRRLYVGALVGTLVGALIRPDRAGKGRSGVLHG
jgi:hypothetical protein